MNLEHPFVLGHYHLRTTDINRLCKQLKFWVYASIKGGMIIGEKRVGKTYAIRYILKNLANIIGRDCYGFSVRWKFTKTFNEKRFWQRLLRATGYDTRLPGDPDRLEQRFYERILLMTEAVGVPVCVIFIDEAQNIILDEYLYLCHVFNELEEKGIRLYTWLVGQTELEHMKTMLAETNQKQVIARFMHHTFSMNGVNNARSLKTLLSQLDKRGVVAEAAEEAVQKGFELDAIATPLWNAKSEVDKECGRDTKTPWTLQQFQSVVAVLLQALGSKPDWALSIGQEELKEVIQLLQVEEPFAEADG